MDLLFPRILFNDLLHFLNSSIDDNRFQEFSIKPIQKEKLPLIRRKGYYKCKHLQIHCVICINNVKKQEFIRNLPCRHEFHKKCIDKWLKIDGVCPICRFKVRLE